MTETVGRSKRSTEHGLKEHEVQGVVELLYKNTSIESALFKSRFERKMIMLNWKMKYGLMNDNLRRFDFQFLITFK